MFDKKEINAPLDKNGNYNIANIKVGQILSQKKIISIPIHDKEPGKQRIIFITDDFQLANINYEKQIPEVANHESLINKCEENIALLRWKNQKLQLLIELANYKQSLFFAEDKSSYDDIYKILLEFSGKLTTEIKVQYQYLNVLTTVFSSIFLIFLLHYINLNQLLMSLSVNFINGLIFGLIGMVASTIYSRISIGKFTTHKIISYRFGYAIIDSILRIILTISVVTIFYVGFKSKLFLNIGENPQYILLFFSSICGFSEHFVPDLLTSYSKKDFNNLEENE
ncbi:MAG: hypothetical protein D8M58_22170 [Calditrichaeota bacterium]|nr:MAG: hypothetical protein DWQ03_08560 [Calditrichota bacterium]MBL1208120.1 hypothetical protein [Calditrichota bacterium]NOG47959.1 hypothetical protein [Calditrichota bacterium]